MTVLELKDKRNKLMTDAAKLIQHKDVTTEHRSQFDAMMVDVDALEGDIARLERTAKFEAEQRSAGRPPRPQPGAEVQGNDNETRVAEKRAFSNFIRFGMGSLSAEERSVLRVSETRDLGTVTAGNITAGAQFVPQVFDSQLVQAQKSWGALTTIVRTLRTDGGQPIKVATSNDTEQQLTVLGEATTVTEADPSLSGLISSTDQCSTGVVKVSFAELEDSAFNIDEFLRDALGKRYWRGITALLNSGSSTGNTQPITTGAPVVDGVSGATITMPYANIVSLYGALDPAYVGTASWVMNSATRAVMLGVTDTLNRPLYIPSPNAGAFDTLLGAPVVINQGMPNVSASSKPLWFGDFRQQYTLRLVGGLSILRLNERWAGRFYRLCTSRGVRHKCRDRPGPGVADGR